MRKDIKQMIDSNSDGLVTGEEIDLANKMQELQEKVRKSESQEKMAWVALVGILIFTAFLFSPYIDVTRLDSIGEFIGMFYITLAGVIATYMGTQAWTMRK